MSSRYPRPNIRKAKLQRFETPFDKMTDAEIADYIWTTYKRGKIDMGELQRRMEIISVVSDLVLDLHLRGDKRVASQALKLAEIVAKKWKVPHLVKAVRKGRFAKEVLSELEPVIEVYRRRTQALYPREWKKAKPSWARS